MTSRDVTRWRDVSVDVTWPDVLTWRDALTWRDVTWRDVTCWRDVTWRDGTVWRCVPGVSGADHYAIFTWSFVRSTFGPKSTLFANMNKVDFGPKVNLKNEQVKWTCGWTCGYSLSACVFPFAFACAFSCASTCALLCIHLLRISHLRSTPGVFLKSPFTTFWNQLMENQQDSTPGLE